MTEKVYQLRTTEIRAALLKETMPRIVFQMITFPGMQRHILSAN